MRSQYASAFRRLPPTRPQAPGATAMRFPASRYLRKRQVIGGATPVFHIQRWGRQTSSGQWPGSCIGSTHDQLKLMRRSVRMRKTGLPSAGGDTPLVTRRWRLPCIAHCSAEPRWKAVRWSVKRRNRNGAPFKPALLEEQFPLQQALCVEVDISVFRK